MPKVSGKTKTKKKNQVGGGWAKHAYGKLHKKSNRKERPYIKIEVKQEVTNL
jgi:hypothetical protein